ncbi:MAG: NERD domain-containing serine/threonine-protein kinase [Thermodesulfovibrio sp.]|nr:NERD domain-containing serine/threonine-protein kinase [Thermodesulfovibrio sp.]
MNVKPIHCGEFVNHSENIAFKKIFKKLNSIQGTDTYIILTNLKLSSNPNGLSDEIDQLIICPAGVILIEVKHWDLSYINNNKITAEKEAEKINEKAKKIKGLLKNHSIDPGFVKGKLLITKVDTLLNGDKNIRGIPLYSLKGLKELLDIEEPSILNETQINRICFILEPKTKFTLTGDIRKFENIINLELISPKEERFHRIYKGQHLLSHDKVILHVFDLSARNEKNAIEIAKREFEIIQKLQKSPYLPRIMDSFQESHLYPGEIYFYSVVEPLAPSLEEIAKDKSIDYENRINIAISCLKALNELHYGLDDDKISIVHRNITPQNIKIKKLSVPVFTELHYGKIPGSTISQYIHDDSFINEYTAPEVKELGLSIADAKSDIYSICKSLCLLFEEYGYEEALDIIKLGISEKPEDRMPLDLLIEELEKLRKDKFERVTFKRDISPNLWDEDTIVSFNNKLYRIISKIGSGGIGQAFKVIQINKADNTEMDTYVAKLVNKKEDGIHVINAYKKIRPHINSQNLVFIYEVADEWEENNFIALFKWINGFPLSDLTEVLPLYSEEIGEESTESMLLRWLSDLCDGLGCIHRAGFVHGDVTPNNILVSRANVIITDYDSVCEIGSEPKIFTALYCSPEVQNRMKIEPSDDIYSLASSIYHVLFGKEPFLFGPERDKKRGLNYDGINIDEYPRLIEFLNKAVHPDRSLRFANGHEAKEFISKLIYTEESYEAEPRIKEKTLTSYNEVPWLKNILRCYPGSIYGNDETRGLDSDFALQTYVETNLDREILIDILNKKVNLVILLGNAGDGKTAFLQNLAKNLSLPIQHSSKRLWDYEHRYGLKIKANLDGSASYQGKTAEELLDEFFEPFIKNEIPQNTVYLLAINSGPLQAWLYQKDENSPLFNYLEKALLGDFSDLPENYRVIDLNNRSLVGNIDNVNRTINTDFLDKLIEKLLGKPENWNPCQTCISSTYCHVWEIVKILLEDLEKANLIKSRLYKAIQAVHQKGDIHITTRELKAALCYIIFGIHYCRDIHEDPSICNERYYDRAFNPQTLHRQGDLLRELSYFNPALEANPKIDKYIMNNMINNSDTTLQFANSSLSSIKRKMYFEWSDKYFEKLSPEHNEYGLAKGKYLGIFREIPFKSENELKEICQKLCIGIAKLENLPTIAFKNENGIPLRITPRTPTETIFWVVKPFDRFSLYPILSENNRYLEQLHTHLELRYNYDESYYERLILGYELFYTLMELSEGVQLTDASSEDIFANLSIFTQRLAQENSRQLFAWHPAEEDKLYEIMVKNNDNIQRVICKTFEG